MGAGILPVAIHNNRVYLLFGKERNRPNETARGWADFGGGNDANETNIETAAREGAEELSGFLGDKSQMAKMLRSKKHVINVDKYKYTTYIVPVTYDKNLPNYFNNQCKFLKEYMEPKRLYHTTMYEKEEIKWFNITTLKKYRHIFRPFYREIIDKVIEEKKEIIKLFSRQIQKKTIRKIRKRNNKTRKGKSII